MDISALFMCTTELLFKFFYNIINVCDNIIYFYL